MSGRPDIGSLVTYLRHLRTLLVGSEAHPDRQTIMNRATIAAVLGVVVLNAARVTD